MASTYFDWLAGKIAEHAKIEVTEQGYDSTALTRLADAAAALRNPAPGAQAFGLSLPPGGVDDAEVLVKRCLEILRERTALLEPEARRELSALLQRLGLDAGVSGPEMPKATHVLRVLLATLVDDAESEEELHDAVTLRTLDGAREVHHASLVDIPPIDEAVGRPREPLKRDTSWARHGSARLVFDREANALRCELLFELTREPMPQQLEALLDAVRGGLFDSSWALNLEWEFPEGAPDVIVHLKQQIVSHVLSPLSSADGPEGEAR